VIAEVVALIEQRLMIASIPGFAAISAAILAANGWSMAMGM